MTNPELDIGDDLREELLFNVSRMDAPAVDERLQLLASYPRQSAAQHAEHQMLAERQLALLAQRRDETERRVLAAHAAGDTRSFDRRLSEATGPGANRPAGNQRRARLPLPADLSDEAVQRLFDAAERGQSTRVEVPAILNAVGPVPGLGETIATPVGADYLDVPRVASLFGTTVAQAPIVRTYRVSTPATAGVVAEGTAKPDAGLALTPVDVVLEKIAVLSKYSRELLEDFPAFVRVIQQELTRAVVTKENSEVTAELLATSGLRAQTSTGDDGIDSTATAIATLEAAGITPTAVVLSPGRLAAIRAVKASTAGSYVIDPTAAAPTRLHGLPVTVTPQLTDTTILVGRFTDAGTLYTRGAMTVATGWDADDFSKNLMSVVAEERMKLAVTQPARIVHVSL